MAGESVLDVVVVGAGPSGLILAKQFAAKNVKFKVFERNSVVGGIWNIEAPNSPMYESAHFISSRTLSGFPGYPMPEDYPDYPSHKQIFEYIKAFSKEFQLEKHIQFDTSIDQAIQNVDGNWSIHLSDGSKIESRYLICANGVTWEPNKVSWDGDFNGEVKHSVNYRNADEFKGKRVLVVGAGNSGVDIACDASFAADQAFLSVRRGYHFMPKHVMGKPADVFDKENPPLPFFIKQRITALLLRLINGDMTRYGLPKPDHKVFQTHPILNTQILHYLGHGDCIAKGDVKRLDGDEVVFVDGSREKIDLIITATGYQHCVPYLEEGVIDFKGGRPDLYLNIFSRKHDNLAVLGFIEFASAAYDNFTKMAELIVEDVVNKNPKLKEMKKNHDPDLQGGHNYLRTKRNANYVDTQTYLNALVEVKKTLGMKAS